MASDDARHRRGRLFLQEREELNRYRFLTFDCYGTLVDWRAGIERSLQVAMGEVPFKGRELLDAYVSVEREEEESYRKYREVLSRSALRLSERLGVELSRRAADQFAESVPDWPAFPDTRAALLELGGMGYKRYILSNVDTDLLIGTIKNNGLVVDGFVTAEEVGSYKPRNAHWKRFMEKTGARREEVLHVAQSVYHDIVPSQEMGISSAWVNRYREPLPSGVQPSFILDSLSSLVLVLKQSNAG